jgi:hypothetical protein
MIIEVFSLYDTYQCVGNKNDTKQVKIQEKKKIIVVNADFGMGGISKSAIEWLDLVDYDKFDITLYIRRNDAIELLPSVNKHVKIITIDSELKKGLFDNSFLHFLSWLY